MTELDACHRGEFAAARFSHRVRKLFGRRSRRTFTLRTESEPSEATVYEGRNGGLGSVQRNEEIPTRFRRVRKKNEDNERANSHRDEIGKAKSTESTSGQKNNMAQFVYFHSI